MPALISEKKQDTPILIIDRNGFIGERLIDALKEEALLIYVSAKQPSSDQAIFVPFNKKFPVIPENNYSHIFVIDDGSTSLKEAFPVILKKAHSDKASFLFVTDFAEDNDKQADYIKYEYSKGKLLAYGDVFDEEGESFKESLIVDFFRQAKKFGRIEVPGDGTAGSHPVFLRDLINAILEASFGNHSETLFYALPSHSVSLLSFAHMLQKNNPHLKIDFIKDKKIIELPLKEGKYLLQENSLDKAVKEMNLSVKEIKNNELPKYEVVKIKKNKKKRPFIFSILLFFIVLFMFIIFTPLTSALIAEQSLKNAIASFEKGDLAKASKSAQTGKVFIQTANLTKAPLMLIAKKVGLGEKIDSFNISLEKGEKYSDVFSYLISSSSDLSDVLQGKSSNSEEAFSNAKNNFKRALAILPQDSSIEQVGKIEPLISFASATVDAWEDLLAMKGKKTYLVLFQNNMELRPGGGFIGSYGLLTLEKGKLSNFEIHDVYDADGQLKGHVEPPFAVRRFLSPDAHWYLRDSNFDPDFTKSAASAAFFLNLETEQKVDGVIGVDIFFIEKLLEGIGEVEVEDYKEKVNSGNVFYLTESHVEKDFFPGSTQKKDFLRSLYKSIQGKITQDKNISYLKIADAVIRSIEGKHLLFAFQTKTVQNIFTANNWSSSLWDDRKKGPSDIKDYIGISEANFGVNKANYFVKRSLSQETEIDENGEITTELTISYKNESNDWPGGDYKNYLRVIAPENSELLEIVIDDQQQDIVDAVTDYSVYEKKNFIAPKGLEVETVNEDGKTFFGFLTTIPKGKLSIIKVKYKINQKAVVNLPDFTYRLRFYKQPGTDDYPYDFSLIVPKELTFIDYPENFKLQGDSKGVFGEKITSDIDIVLKIGKQ